MKREPEKFRSQKILRQRREEALATRMYWASQAADRKVRIDALRELEAELDAARADPKEEPEVKNMMQRLLERVAAFWRAW